jgi:glycosyltransferase involved in cell wall biosynthesis
LKKALVFTTHHFQSPLRVGSYYYAEYFLKKVFDILYVSAPITPLHLFRWSRVFVKDRISINKRIQKIHGSSLHHLVPFSLIAPDNLPILRSAFIQNNWHNTILNTINYSTKPDLIYIDNPFYHFIIDKYHNSKIIFRLTDKFSGFPGSNKNVEKIIGRIISESDLTIYCSESNKEFVDSYSPKESLFVPNGIDYSVYDETKKELPQEFVDIPEPRAIYVGATSEWLDVDLLLYCSKQLLNWNFIIVGPITKHIKKLEHQDNIHILGTKKSEDVPLLLQNSQAGLIPFNVSEYPDLIQGINPIKLYEYLGAGLKVVSTYWKEMERINSPASLCSNKEEFVEAIKQNEKSEYKFEARSFAKKFDWYENLKVLDKYL